MGEARLRRIVILGGGTAGWIAAAGLVNRLKQKYIEVVLIESESIPTVGVGEATIPPMRTFLQSLGINERDFIRKTNASFKLGIKFSDWHTKGDAYFHAFGKTGVVFDKNEFYRSWDRARANGYQGKFTDFCPAVSMCQQNKFYREQDVPKESFVSGASYAYHFDAGLMARYLSDYAQTRGIKRIEGTVTEVTKDSHGYIRRLTLSDGTPVEGDFFIDCSGFKGILIEETLKTGYTDWRDYLPCDRAVTVQSEQIHDIPPYTHSVAKDSGWMWQIPLQNRMGNGYVFSSRYCSDEKAKRTLLEALGNQTLISDIRFIPFTTGVRKKLWNKNCLALGLSSGFLEPLESTAIHLVVKSLEVFMTMLPDGNCDELLSNEFNRIMLQEYENIRDFIILHYCTTQRDDSPFWDFCRHMPIPPSLQEKIALFQSKGVIFYNPYDLFKPVNWYSVFEGMKVHPKRQDPITELTDIRSMVTILDQMRLKIDDTVRRLPSHRAFLNTYGQT